MAFSPLFAKACPERRRREGKGRFSEEMTAGSFWNRTLALPWLNEPAASSSSLLFELGQPFAQLALFSPAHGFVSYDGRDQTTATVRAVEQ